MLLGPDAPPDGRPAMQGLTPEALLLLPALLALTCVLLVHVLAAQY
jgi:hypothetical protein